MAIVYLRGHFIHCPGRSHRSAVDQIVRQLTGNSKITQFEITHAAIEYIAFLNVTVNNILLLTVIQCITDIDSNFEYIIHGDLSCHYILAQISQKFHSYKNRIGVTVSDHCIIDMLPSR